MAEYVRPVNQFAVFDAGETWWLSSDRASEQWTNQILNL